MNNAIINEFTVGCNYWASHAGISMWEDWNPAVIENDFKKLSEYGVEVLRVFPLWPVFQPISLLYAGSGVPMEYRINGLALANDEEGCAGISANAISHFDEFAKLAEKYNFRLIVGLVTGWMSGRLFVPPALEGRDILTDATAIKWQVRFVKYFAKRFVNCKAIVAWDLGNECNCMGVVSNQDEAWLWSSSIVSAIRSIDQSRPIISGMHSLTVSGKWTIQDQGELTDILTTHPYPIFTPYCDKDPLNTIRPIIHSTCESVLYADIGRKPCIVEEIGNLGPMVSSDAVAADFGRVTMLSTWAHGCGCYLWWCANDKSQLEMTPYDWYSTERELGLLNVKGEPKPILESMRDFRVVLKGLPLNTLPDRIKDAVCILSHDQDQWGVAFGSFILGKQVGIDMEFVYAGQDIKDASIYFLPSIKGHRVLSRRQWHELLKRIYNGAVLYVSYDGGFLSHFEQVAGIRVETRFERGKNTRCVLKTDSEELLFEIHGDYGVNINPLNAEVLGREVNGNPIFTCAEYGKGKVYFLGTPIELYCSKKAGIFHEKDAQPLWRIYITIKSTIKSSKCVLKNNPMLGITEHPIDDNTRVVVAINYCDSSIEDYLELSEGWVVESCLYGMQPCAHNNKWEIKIEKNNANIFVIERGR